MFDKILSALAENKISEYLINDTLKESVELFFIKKSLDMRRQKDVHHYSVTVYHDFSKDNIKMRGSSTISLFSGMTEAEISNSIKNAYYAASFVCNPYYDLPSGQKEALLKIKNALTDLSLSESAKKMTTALFEMDTEKDTFLNSAEIFLEKVTNRIVNSRGIDVSYEKTTVKGEFVAQCVTPQDVETYQSFSYDNLDTEALKTKVKQTLAMTKARANANTAPAAGEYTVLLSGQYVRELFHYYLNRSSAGMIYPKYSNYQIGSNVQGEDVQGEALNITLIANEPYSSEGIPMKDLPLVAESKLETIHGNSRFCHYLGITPTGQYQSIKVPSGSLSFDDMKKEKYLHVVNFSDFQMDDFSGHFGGEIRLAFLYDGKTVTPVTGGSINGSILDVQRNFSFSKELQVEEHFEGPFAVKLEHIRVAGI
ncbi:hypothetical protein acsn021_35970 [Anaerocolumna cellulosilytica]|uniref:Metalloprotease TldD/E C-terminal domain-containing protein n=1 Tax=Anaerocolumna cellulosilytica TaxID=433286 RepID=A0A6S6RAR4_9FIRM|nr:hypothetical protein acsn021_35970 [Anaerocolumna cellulosilytica]